ncbi:polysaccharide lyase family 7 protein [Didymella exigua CBS 183.55]|uniref:Polysaccharide lyase family 7 protein n=1 Tax=Didymella exigua CBS 183.55 TaxID=1150837 RepID=A0A6A5RWB4_9PLEO|nr:polysaccharide lyase family 7 protein [Didymella exigua CBS 183.55]KAF1931600.1 polysaccharide lyase family 7 protein [Didymella exigua CBS 183.55]
MAQRRLIATVSLQFIEKIFAAPFSGQFATHLRNSNPPRALVGNLELASFNLQLPTGSSGKINQVHSTKLSGCDGWKSPDYFYTSPSGALVMKVPSRSRCVTTPNSKLCRTELQESYPKSWNPRNSVNLLKVRLSVIKPGDSKYGTVVG